jgi:hypothetical protein
MSLTQCLEPSLCLSMDPLRNLDTRLKSAQAALNHAEQGARTKLCIPRSWPSDFRWQRNSSPTVTACQQKTSTTARLCVGRTSVRALTARDNGPEKSPYLTVNLESPPSCVKLCTTSGWVSADAIRRTKSLGPFFWTLRDNPGYKAENASCRWGYIPSIEYVYSYLLSSSLNCGNFIVRDGYTGVVIADLAKGTLADE